MKAYLIQIDAWAGSTATPVRLASHDDDSLCHLDGQTWWPAIATLPTLRYDFFDGAFDASAITSPTGSFTAAIDAIPNLPALALHDTRVRVWRGELGDAWGSFALIFDGRVKEQPAISDGIASFSIGTDDSWLDHPLLSTYAGTGGAEGSTDLQGQVKPLALGAPRFAPAVLVDAVDNIYQISAYGAINGVTLAFDRLTRFGAVQANYASFATLDAATVTRGRWATSLAGGYVRLGAPADGLVSFHVEGDAVGGWSRLPGALIARIAAIAGGTAKVASADITALNAARPWNLSLMVTAQTTARELIQRIAASVNAVAYVDWLGMLRVAAVGIGTPTLTMAADGSALPPVASVEQVAIAAPYWRLSQGAVPTWQVHAPGDIAYNLREPQGEYQAGTAYREGDIVSLPNGSQWLFIGATPVAGSAPATGNANWQQIAGPVVPVANDGTSLEQLLGDLQGAVDAKRVIFVRQTAPSAAESQENDWWNKVDASGKLIATYRRVAGTGRLSIGSSTITIGGNYISLCWAPVEDERIGNALAAATAAADLADSKAVVFTMFSSTDPVPVGTNDGDLLVRVYLDPTQIDRWDGSVWRPAATFGATADQLTSIAAALTDAANAKALIDGNITVYYQPSPPAGAYGDLWFDTDDNNKMYRRDTDGWKVATNTSLGLAISAAAGAQATADGKVKTFSGESTPVATGVGDLWYKPSTKTLTRWNGSTWAVASPANVADGATVGAPSGTNVGGTPATTVEAGGNAANGGLNGDGTVKTDKVSTGSIVAEAVTKSYYASLASPILSTGVGAITTVLTLSVAGVAAGEVLRLSGMMRLECPDDLQGEIYIAYDINGSGGTAFSLDKYKFDSDGGASTQLAIPLFGRLIAPSAGTYNFFLYFINRKSGTDIGTGTSFDVMRQRR
ncbi:hypothetical protein FIM10_02190 [Sphingomonadales bacterium 56]|uniref:hypothetical protein n=1 Tax=Sphingobium sp. S6 TaxID=2758386 RepID=UPI00191B44D8|nr:hypothetical protein [Sphingobium sp. S6]MBY2927491.1 hypothetical protein [Sphingomonadales bacterium 56]CAD7335332.1 hypothetical protein SPHS6_00445 [Sphingobium sp. S6]